MTVAYNNVPLERYSREENGKDYRGEKKRDKKGEKPQRERVLKLKKKRTKKKYREENERKEGAETFGWLRVLLKKARAKFTLLGAPLRFNI